MPLSLPPHTLSASTIHPSITSTPHQHLPPSLSAQAPPSYLVTALSIQKPGSGLRSSRSSFVVRGFATSCTVTSSLTFMIIPAESGARVGRRSGTACAGLARLARRAFAAGGRCRCGGGLCGSRTLCAFPLCVCGSFSSPEESLVSTKGGSD